MNAIEISILICTHGSDDWGEAAWTHAYPSASAQEEALEVIVAHERNSTLAQVRNTAAAGASGNWLLFLDADDRLGEGYVEKMECAARAASSELRFPFPLDPGIPEWQDRVPVSLLAPAVQYVDHRGNCKGKPAIPNLGRWPDMNECVIGTLIPTYMFRWLGGFRELPSLEDYDLWLRAVKHGAKIVHVPDAVYCAHSHSGGRNSDQAIYQVLREEHAAVWASAP